MRIDISKENLLIVFVFVSSTSFFIYQHSTGISWDFSVYVLNAKYIFSDGKYFEWLRPPLIPVFLGLFSLFGWKASEYLFIIFTSGLFLFSSIKLSKKLNLPKHLYYAFSMNFFTLVYSFSSGSELLSLSFLQFFLANLEDWSSGIFLSLSILSRYSNLIYLPLILLKKNFKKNLIGFLICFVVSTPWLIYNFLKTGDPLSSPIDFYFMNVKFRADMREKINIKYFFVVGNILTPLIFIGLIEFLKSKGENFWVISIFFLLLILSYFIGAFKEPRYLFNITLIFSYFSSIAFQKIFKKKMVLICLSLFFCGLILAIIYSEPLEKPDIYEKVSKNLDLCETRSNAWVFLNYFGFQSGPIPWKHQVEEMINNGTRFVIFKKIKDLDWEDFWDKFGKINETEDYFIIGNVSICKPQRSFQMMYFELLKEACGFDVDKYSIIFSKEKLCSTIKYCEDFKTYVCG